MVSVLMELKLPVGSGGQMEGEGQGDEVGEVGKSQTTQVSCMPRTGAYPKIGGGPLKSFSHRSSTSRSVY